MSSVLYRILIVDEKENQQIIQQLLQNNNLTQYCVGIPPYLSGKAESESWVLPYIYEEEIEQIYG